MYLIEVALGSVAFFLIAVGFFSLKQIWSKPKPKPWVLREYADGKGGSYTAMGPPDDGRDDAPVGY